MNAAGYLAAGQCGRACDPIIAPQAIAVTVIFIAGLPLVSAVLFILILLKQHIANSTRCNGINKQIWNVARRMPQKKSTRSLAITRGADNNFFSLPERFSPQDIHAANVRYAHSEVDFNQLIPILASEAKCAYEQRIKGISHVNIESGHQSAASGRSWLSA